jgi:hypothetical protein
MYGQFADGQMIGGIYKLEQGMTTFLTLFDQNKYIIVEQGRGLNRYFVLTNAGDAGNEYNGAFGAPQFYNLTHYVVPSVIESARVQQISNKRSIDQDVKELFSIKNAAHHKFENECFEQIIAEVS